MATVIACVIEKGGTGKTTTVVNLAALMAKNDKKVLVVDVDLQSNATYMLTGSRKSDNAYEGQGLVNMLAAYSPDMDIHRFIHKTNFKRIHLIPGTAQTPRAIGVLTNLADAYGAPDYSFLLDCLKGVSSEYDYILFDTPPARDVLTMAALYTADEVIIPIRCDSLSIEGLETTVNLINELERKEDMEIHILGVLLTQTERTSVVNVVKKTLEKSEFGSLLFKTCIRKGSAVSESTLLAEPVVSYAKSSNPSADYKDLYSEIKSRLKKRNEED